MIPLFSEEEFKSSKSRDLLPLRCKQCNKTFHRPKFRLQYVKSKTRNELYDFCSRTCDKENRQPKPSFCKQCGKQFSRKKSQTSRSKNLFCSRSCSVTWNNKHKKHGTRLPNSKNGSKSNSQNSTPTLNFTSTEKIPSIPSLTSTSPPSV